MIWARPWALAGLAFVALPILIHMMGRGRATVVQFPSLRFLDSSRLLPARRTRVHDVVLLVMRCLVITAATVALAGPVWGPRSIGSTAPDEVNRLIIVDTGASMARSTPSGATALVAARRFADSVRASTPLGTVVETAQPAAALPGAAAWLVTRRGAGEIAIISDFQLGTIDSVALAAVPASVGLRFMRVPLGAPGRTGPPAPLIRASISDVVTVLAGRAERAGADAAAEAAREVGRLNAAAGAGVRRVALVHPRYERRSDLLRSAATFTDASDVAFIARVVADSLLVQSAIDATLADSAATPAGSVVVARNRSGQAAAFAAWVSDDGPAHLAFFSAVDAASPASVALHVAIARAAAAHPPSSEFETESLSDAVLAGWQRAPGAAPLAESTAVVSDGNPLDTAARWFWLAALALLVVETWARTSPLFANTFRPAGAQGAQGGPNG